MATPRTTPARAAAAPVALNLDTLEREGAEIPPFVINVAGKRVTLLSIEDIDWQLAASLSEERPHQFFEAVVPEANYEDFIKAKFPLWKMRVLTKEYRAHYGLDDIAQGN